MGISGNHSESSVDKKSRVNTWGKVAVFAESFLRAKNKKNKVITRRYKYDPQSTAPTTTTKNNI